MFELTVNNILEIGTGAAFKLLAWMRHCLFSPPNDASPQSRGENEHGHQKTTKVSSLDHDYILTDPAGNQVAEDAPPIELTDDYLEVPDNSPSLLAQTCWTNTMRRS